MPSMTTELQHDKWAGTTYGNSLMLKSLRKMLKVCPVRFLYAVAYIFVVPVLLVGKRRYRRPLARFYRDNLNLRRTRLWRMLWRNHCAFARVVIDRFAAFAGKRYDLDVTGYNHYLDLARKPQSFMQLSCHIGHYEMAGYILDAVKKPINAVLFAGEKEEVMRNRIKLFSGNSINMIAMRSDMSHLFEINNAISRGEIISMDADRIFGSQKYYSVPFMKGRAHIPQGAFRIAALNGLRVLFIAVVSPRPCHYRAIVCPIDIPDGLTSTASRAEAMVCEYARLMEQTVSEYPAQWFNYFDFTHNE